MASENRTFLFYWRLLRLPLIVGAVLNFFIFIYNFYLSTQSLPFDNSNILIFCYLGYILGKKYGAHIAESLLVGVISGVILALVYEIFYLSFKPEYNFLFGIFGSLFAILFRGFVGSLFTTFISIVVYFFYKFKNKKKQNSISIDPMVK